MFLKQIYRLFLIVLLVTVGMAGAGNAAQLSYDFTIQYLQGPGTNPYGLNLGDTVSVDVNFDPNQGITSEPGLRMHNRAEDTTFGFSLDFGNTTFTGGDDIDWPDFPVVTFNTFGSTDTNDWTFNVIDFWWVDDTDADSWVRIEVPNQFNPIVLTAGGIDLQGNPWHLSSVPEPATMTLFGIGLLGLAGITRRSRQ